MSNIAADIDDVGGQLAARNHWCPSSAAKHLMLTGWITETLCLKHIAGKLGTHNNGLYRSETFRYGQEHSHLLSTQFKVRMIKLPASTCCHRNK